jgi:hypothetical protein
MMQESEILSDFGRERREEILRLAKRHARSLRRNRHLRGGGILLVGLAIIMAWRGSGARHPQTARISIPAPVALRAPTVVIERIATDPQIVERMSIGNERPKWSFIDDDAFLHSMADAGRPSGLVNLNGRLLLLPR